MSKNRIALIPAYQPDICLAGLVQKMRGAGIQIVVVDDGSSPDKEELFQLVEEYATVLHHDRNYGKGRALKTGLEYIQDHFLSDYIVVTVDADGQHKPDDVNKVCDAAEENIGAIILGSRKMKGNVPVRSRFGNTVTRFVYWLFTKKGVYDTQTGLRAFSGDMIPELLNIEGERYEYEMNVLLTCSGHQIPIKEVEIETIYMNENQSSHFDTLRDSYRIYKEILKFSASSFASFLLDYGMYSLLALMTTYSAEGRNVALSNVGARMISSVFNYTVNREMVFQSEESRMQSAIQYFLLAAGILAGNTLVLELLVNGIGIDPYAGKLFVECLFFFVSWFIQSHFIFKARKRGV